MLLSMLLFVALLSIGALAMVERIEQQIKRDREEELIHRGAQYSRAVGRFVKTLGRYPASIEELENTNNIRYLRKRYKDPITGKDFHILHLGDVDYLNVSTSPVGAGGTASPQPQQAIQGASKASGVSGPAQNTGSGAEKSVFGDASEQQASSGAGEVSDPTNENGPDPTQAAAAEATPTHQLPWSNQSSLTIDHRAILGVVSTSDKRTIREFHGKNGYNQWLFIYTPLNDHAGLLQMPDQRPLNAGANAQNPTSPDGSTPEQQDVVSLGPEKPSEQ